MAESGGTHEQRSDHDDTKHMESDSDLLSDHLLLTVAAAFGQEWENVALSLNLKMNEVEQLKLDYKLVKDQATNMLIRWRNRRGREQGLIEELCSALTEQGRKDMSDDLKKLILQKQKTEMVDKGTKVGNGNNAGKEKSTGRTDSIESDDGQSKSHPRRLDSHVSNQDCDLLDILDMENEHFVETTVLNRATQILKEKKIIFIIGQNGSGKTSLAYHLYCKIDEDIDDDDVMFCGNLDDILDHLEVEKNKVFFLDDVFGTLMVDNDAIDKWSKMMKDIPQFRRSQADAGCTTYLIFCCRKEIMDKVSAQIPCEFTLDMSNEPMEDSEKRKIFKQIWQRHNPRLDMPSYVCSFDFPENNYLGFWFCVNFHARRYHSHGKSFWDDPMNILSKEMKKHLEDKTIPQQLFEKLSNKHHIGIYSETTSDIFRLVGKEFDICRQFPEFFKELIDRECFEFQHALLHEQIELHLAKKDVQKAIKTLSVRSLHNITVSLPKKSRTRPAKKMQRDFCLMSEREVIPLLSRLMKEVKCGNACEVCRHNLWKEDRCVNWLDEQILKKSSRVDIKEILTTTDNTYGENILYWSTRENRTKLCQTLVHYLKNDDDIDDQRDILSRSLLGACLVKRNISIVDELIRKGANVSYCHACHLNEASSCDDSDHTSTHSCPLDVAIENGNNNHTIQLLKNKALIPHNTWPDWQILNEAANLEDELLKDPTFLEGVKHLFNNLHKERESLSYLETNKYHQFLSEIKESCYDVHDIFLEFAKHGILSYTMLQAFLNCKANINKVNVYKENALHLLVASDDDVIQDKCQVIQTLLKNGCNGNQRSKRKETPLTMAIKRDSFKTQIVEALLLNGYIDPNIVSRDGKTPLHNCVEDILKHGEVIPVVSLLRRFGCQDKPDKDGYTALDRILIENVLKIDFVTSIADFPLHACIESSNLSCGKKCEIIDQLVTRGIDINSRDKCNHSPLSKAIAIGCDQQLIACLLKLNADCGLTYKDEKSILQVLFLSQSCPSETIADAFVKSDACLCKGQMAAAIIAEGLKSPTSQFCTIMKIFSEYSGEIVRCNTFQDSDHKNLLHLCMVSSLEDNECLQLSQHLLDNGFSTNKVDCSNNTAFDLAVKNDKMLRTNTIIMLFDTRFIGRRNFKQTKFFKDLFNSGQICVGILRAAMRKNLIDASIKYKKNLLHLLGEKGYLKTKFKTVKDFLPLQLVDTTHESSTRQFLATEIAPDMVSSIESTPDVADKLSRSTTTMPDEQIPENSCTVIKRTLPEGSREAELSELIECLCTCGFGIDDKDNSGRTPLFLACCCEIPDIDLIKALNNNNADVNTQDKEGRTPLHGCLASKMDDSSSRVICEILKNKNAKVNKKDCKCRSPLLTALEKEVDRSTTVRFLLESWKADVNVQDIKGDGCLHYCLSRNVEDYRACTLLELLLEFNPDIECTNELKLTPLNFAATYHTRSRILCMVYLLSKHANVNAIDAFRRTPLVNVLRCLGGHDDITYKSFERIVRLALLFAFKADPTYHANEYREHPDAFVSEMVKDYPAIQIDKLVSYISNKLKIISKRHTEKDKFPPPFAFKPGDPKRKLYEMVIEASRYLTNVYFTESVTDDIIDSNGDSEAQAQVAVEPGRYCLTPKI